MEPPTFTVFSKLLCKYLSRSHLRAYLGSTNALSTPQNSNLNSICNVANCLYKLLHMFSFSDTKFNLIFFSRGICRTSLASEVISSGGFYQYFCHSACVIFYHFFLLFRMWILFLTEMSCVIMHELLFICDLSSNHLWSFQHWLNAMAIGIRAKPFLLDICECCIGNSFSLSSFLNIISKNMYLRITIFCRIKTLFRKH